MTKKAYGSKVVGKEEAQRLLKANEKKARFGPKVLGSKVDQRSEEEVHQDQANREARDALAKKTDNPVPEELDELVRKYATDDGYLSIENTKQVLEELPSALDRMIAWEMDRNDGPRIGALKHFIGMEAERQGGPRKPVLEHLEKALAAARAGS